MTINPQAKKAINTACVAAAGVCASPIPFSDSALLIPIQTTMIAAIYKANGQQISEGLITGALKATATAAIGKGVAGNLLKFIPGVGTVVGTAINASVAVGFTKLLGNEIAKALENESPERSIDLMEVLHLVSKNFKPKA